MLFELMTNGTIARLPSENTPDNEKSVMLLLPHNKYLLGSNKNSGKWTYGENNGKECRTENIYLYDGQPVSLLNEAAAPTILTAGTVDILRKELLALSDPPGNHTSAVLMMRTLMRGHEIFKSENADYLDEEKFMSFLKTDSIFERLYWTLRFALNRGEMETLTRLKVWLRAGPEVFSQSIPEKMRLWFSILGLPDGDGIKELEELKFTQLELKRIADQNASPIVVYNPASGWLVLGRFGRYKDTMFFMWAYFTHELWNELRERRKFTVQEILQASWGEYDTRQAMSERAKYRIF